MAVDLGASPLANSILSRDRLQDMEPTWPLLAYVCSDCHLMQLSANETPENIFADYSYFSSFSDDWLEHVERYAETMVKRLALGSSSKVVEIASNDGCLLQCFARLRVPVLGIEPARNVASEAISRGIPTEIMFFGREAAEELANQGLSADLIVANNVLAHVPDVNGFIAGTGKLLKPHGMITVEFPHLLNLIELTQFDTIYHEHLSYFSLAVVERLFARQGLKVVDVEELTTHGGSLRLYAKHADQTPTQISHRMKTLLAVEAAAGLDKRATYQAFRERVYDLKLGLLEFLISARRAGKTVAGYGAPAKGNTLLNYCGVGPELLPYTVDRSPHKQSCFLPGTRIPIKAPNAIFEQRPDYLLILPWNLKEEISTQMEGIREWGGKFVTPSPSIEIF